MAVQRQAMLFRPRKNGKNLYDQMLQVASHTGKWPEDYALLEPPPDFGFVWHFFWEMRNHNKSEFARPESLSFAEIDAWQRVRGIRLGNWLLDMILAMDGAYMEEMRKDGS